MQKTMILNMEFSKIAYFSCGKRNGSQAWQRKNMEIAYNTKLLAEPEVHMIGSTSKSIKIAYVSQVKHNKT